VFTDEHQRESKHQDRIRLPEYLERV
jgi:hypothetical protein